MNSVLYFLFWSDTFCFRMTPELHLDRTVYNSPTYIEKSLWIRFQRIIQFIWLIWNCSEPHSFQMNCTLRQYAYSNSIYFIVSCLFSYIVLVRSKTVTCSNVCCIHFCCLKTFAFFLNKMDPFAKVLQHW